MSSKPKNMKFILKGKVAIWTPEVLQALGEAAAPGLKQCALLVEEYAKRSMKAGGRILKTSITKAGKVDKKPEKEAKGTSSAGGKAPMTGFAKAGKKKRKSKYASVASAPGTPPHVQTGMLRGSITSTVFKFQGRYRGIAGSTKEAWYGRIHEEGGEFGGRNYPARPFMKPALAKAAPKFGQVLARALAKAAQTPTGQALKGKKLV